jgi:signal transduction histidine kinase
MSPIPWKRRWGFRYFLSALLALTALVITLAFQPHLSSPIPFLVFNGAVIVAAWQAGFFPALFTVACSIVLIDYFLIPPIQSFATTPSDLAAFGVFAVEGTLIAYAIDHLIRTQSQLRTLYRHSNALLQEPTVTQVLTASMDILGAEKADIQIYDPNTATLRMVGQCGFPAKFLDRFRLLPTTFSTCGLACKERRRVMVRDISVSRQWNTLLPVFKEYGVVSVQSTPMYRETGAVFGVLSTYTSKVHAPSEGELRLLDLYLRQAERVLETKHREEDLRQANDDLVSTVTMQSGQLAEKAEWLQSAITTLSMTEERQRQQLVSELHDHLGQLLALAKMKVTQAVQILETSPDVSRRYLAETQGMLNSSLDYARTLMAELVPRELHESGLAAALRWLAPQMSKHGLAVDVSLADDVIPVSNEEAALLYQLVRELLINIVKHARVDRASVSVSVDHFGVLTIMVEDYGSGFDMGSLERSRAAGHFGLSTIPGRMTAIGGSAYIASHRGKGTSVKLFLPLRADFSRPSRAASSIDQSRVVLKRVLSGQSSLPFE